jgi:flavin reductase (DIM6/NTAB) family NADH-FMN oxidoreductase RutF
MDFKTISPFELNANFFHEIGEQWMLVAAAKPDGSANAMTAAWGGIGFIWQQPAAFVFIRPQRYTKTFVEAAATLSLSFFDSAYRDTLNFMGTVSGYNDAEKIAHSGLTLAFHETGLVREQPARDGADGGRAGGAGQGAAGGAALVERTPYFSEARLVLVCERLYQQDMLAECFLDTAQFKQFYGKCGDENDLHTLYIAGVRQVLVPDEAV